MLETTCRSCGGADLQPVLQDEIDEARVADVAGDLAEAARQRRPEEPRKRDQARHDDTGQRDPWRCAHRREETCGAASLRRLGHRVLAAAG